MKNEQYFKLLPLEGQLRSAQQSNYARLSASDFAGFCQTYKDIFGKELTRSEQNCNVCRLKAIKAVAEEYVNYQKWYVGRWGKKPEESIETKDNVEFSKDNELNTEQNAQGNSEGNETRDE